MPEGGEPPAPRGARAVETGRTPVAEARPPRRRSAWSELVGAWAAGALPGILAGIHLAGLIFFLNPNLPFEPAAVLAVAWRLCLLGGAATGLALTALTTLGALTAPGRGRRARALRLLPWGLTFALVTAAIVDGGQAAHFAYFLSPAVNTRLIKTALWLTLGALLCFYTALLHSVQRRPYGRRSRAGLLLVALVSVGVMVERREALSVVRAAPAPRPAALDAQPRRRALVVGVDTASLDALLPLIAQGRLPFLGGMLRQGAYGRLQSFTPVRREALWMTLATGLWPYRHGVLGNRTLLVAAPGGELSLGLTPAGVGFSEWGPVLGHWRRRDRFERAVPALWEILPRLGMGAAVVGWPGSAPVSRETVFSVSDSFFERDDRRQGIWPEELWERARLFRVDPREVSHSAAATPPRPRPWLEGMAWDRSRQSLSLFLAAGHPDLGGLFVYLPGLRKPSAAWFGGFWAAQLEGDTASPATRASDLYSSYLEQLDGYLAELWQRQGRPEVFALVSAYGVEAPGGWRRRLPDVTGEGAIEGRMGNAPDGLLLLAGTGVRPGLLTGARLVDVAPTLLYALDFPSARDLDGEILAAAFTKPFLASHPVTFLPSYQGLVPAADRRPAALP